MALICRHDYMPAYTIRGENMLGESMWAVAFLCCRCGKRRLRKGYRSQAAAEHKFGLLQELASHPLRRVEP